MNNTVEKNTPNMGVVITYTHLGIEAQNAEVFAPETLAQTVRAYLQNARQGTVHVKDRSELISRANRKPWKQKGTGKARAGTPRSPLWRGGAVSHGPQARVRTLKANRGMIKGVLRYLLHTHLVENQVLSLDFAVVDKPKTALAFKALQSAGLQDKKVLLFLDVQDYQSYNAFGNLENVAIIGYDHPHVYALADAPYWVFLKKDEALFREMVNSWI